MDGILHREQTAPGLAEQHEVGLIESESPADLLDLIDEPVSLPQRRVGGMVAAERSELVVVVVLDTGGRKTGVEALNSSLVAPGPPCSRRTFTAGLLPTRLVQTRNSPAGVLTGTIREPPEMTSLARHVDVSKYEAAGSVTKDNLSRRRAAGRRARRAFRA
jgi:hypothetical protein